MTPEPLSLPERLKRLPRLLWQHLLTGIVIAVPLIVSLWVLSLGYSFIAKISEPIWETLGVSRATLLNFCTTLLLLLGIGFMAAHVVGQRIIERTESVLMRVPLVAPLYGAVKQMLDSFRLLRGGPDGESKRVVYVEYPSPGCLLLGFVTGHFHEPTLQREFTLVFLPMAPNPLAGFVVAIPPEKIIPCSLTFEEASKLIVSGGLVVPVTPAAAPAQNPPQPGHAA